MSDPLATYRAKRDFAATPEPGGAPPPAEEASALRFVVQEHHARRLHWDLRLEHDGVLVSWALPKGVPPDPKVNHLAVPTEDHPIEYLDFAGDIPGGQYGAGSMSIWDRGTYDVVKWSDREVMVDLHGERVDGRYVLFRTGDRQWMIHRMTPPADATYEQMPDRLKPMSATPSDVLPRDDSGWAFEIKWDGYRVLSFVSRSTIRLHTRNELDCTADFPELAGIARQVGAHDVILDGEVVAFDAEGRPSFEALQARGKPGTGKRRLALHGVRPAVARRAQHDGAAVPRPAPPARTARAEGFELADRRRTISARDRRCSRQRSSRASRGSSPSGSTACTSRAAAPVRG